jgi:hypothetical protein
VEYVAHAMQSGASHAPWSLAESGRRLYSKWIDLTTLAISEMLWLSDILVRIYRIIMAYLLSSPRHESRLVCRQTPRFLAKLCDSIGFQMTCQIDCLGFASAKLAQPIFTRHAFPAG